MIAIPADILSANDIVSDRSTVTFFVMPSVSATDSDRLVTISLTTLSANDIVSENEIILDFIVELLSVNDIDSYNFLSTAFETLSSNKIVSDSD